MYAIKFFNPDLTVHSTVGRFSTSEEAWAYCDQLRHEFVHPYTVGRIDEMVMAPLIPAPKEGVLSGYQNN